MSISGRDQLVELLYSLEENAERSAFISELKFLDEFNEDLFIKVFDEIYHHAPPNSDLARSNYHRRIFKNFRLCLAILIKIGRPALIFPFCEDPRIGDDKIPIPKEILLEIPPNRDGSDRFATTFYKNQFMFKPIAFDDNMRGNYIALPSERVVPIIRNKPLGKGGWGVVHAIEIHPDYDRLGYSPQGREKPHAYACKQLQLLDGDDNEGKFRREVNIQYALQDRSPHILPLLAAYKQNDRYRMVFPQADYNLHHLMHNTDPPETPEDKWAFLERLLGIVDAIRAIHDHSDKDTNITINVRGHTIGSQDQLMTIGSHRDLTPQNILLKGDRLLLADFGEARIRSIKPGEETGSEWLWGCSTYVAPECERGREVGRGGDIWSLACIISEILTFLLFGRNGCSEYSNARTKEADIRDSFHDNHVLKVEVKEWFKKLTNMSGQSKVVVDILELLFEMLHQNPKSRPRISVVEQRLSKILQHQVPLCVIRPEKLGAPEGTDEHESDTYDDGVEVLAKVTPRTSKDRYSILSRLSIPFTYTSLMPWNWIYPTKTEPPIPKVGRTQSQPFKAMTSRKQLRAPSLTSQELRDSMAPRAPLKDHLEGPLQALQGYDTVFLVDDSKIDEQHWLQMGQVLINVASVAMQLDPDGIDIRFVASDHCEVEEVKAWKDVADAFSSVQPCERRLVLGHRVNSILEPYIQAQADKEKGYRHSGPSKSKTHLNLIVLTDGQLDDDDDLDKVIINCVKRLDELRAPSGSIGVQFVLFGRRDSRLSRLFEYLDDEVAVEIGSLRDIVDTTEFSREMLEDRNAFKKILCGSINKTLDGPGRLAPGNSSSTDPGNSSTRRRAT